MSIPAGFPVVLSCASGAASLLQNGKQSNAPLQKRDRQ